MEGGGGSFVIDKSLLKKIKFIHEGEFEERSGVPVLKVVGKVVPVQGEIIPTAKIQKTNLTEQDILMDFLLQARIEDAGPYLRQMCHGAQVWLPIYYYASASQISLDEAIAIIQSERTTHPSTKKKVLARLSKLLAPPGAPAIRSCSGERKVLTGEVPYKSNAETNLPMLVRAIRGVRGAELNPKLCFEILNDACKRAREQGDAKLFDEVRYSASYLDQEIYGRPLIGVGTKKATA